MDKRYWEDFDEAERAAFKARARAALEALERADYPLTAWFGPDRVTVLGPCDRFEPYKSDAEEWMRRGYPRQVAAGGQMLCERDGRRFITFATMLHDAGGEPLVPRIAVRERFALPDPPAPGRVAT